MKERWKKIAPGYEVSDCGRVRSYWLNRYLRDSPQRILSTPIGSHGYRVVNIGRANQYTIGRLVLQAFVGESRLSVCHNSGIKTDDRLSNLRWDTAKGNATDRDRHGTRWLGERSPNAKLTVILVKRLRAEMGISKRGLARKYGISLDTCRKALDGRTWGGY